MRRQRLTTQERSDLRALGVTVKVLARATTATGPVIALPGHLVWQTGQGWDQVAWHDIVRGSWQPASNRLGWWDGTGHAHGLDLVEPGSLPWVFREQIDSTILV
ncbi:MAG: hypothetical protein LBL92_01985, partial [Propionibacteriaceae bacterium]|nr:hypothetical protein [Propionibacteriaceae bacterium]